MKIMIYGFSGSGKSTLASYIGKKYNIPTLFLDTVHFKPGWVERDLDSQNAIIQAFMDQNDAWVIDGNYSKSLMERRIEEADQIIFMCFNRYDCYKRAYQRYLDHKGKTRESMTAGCDETFDFEFACWILWNGRDQDKITRFTKIVEDHPKKAIMIHNQKELDEYMKKL